MQLEARINMQPAVLSLDALLELTPKLAKRTVVRITGDMQRVITRSRLSGRPGLNSRSGALRRALMTSVKGDTVPELTGRMGFFDAHAAMVARVQELGTVGAGGSLPDIVPRRKKLLSWNVLASGRALSYARNADGSAEKAFAKSVAIPPRLGFHSTLASPFVRGVVQQRLRQGAEELVAEASRG